MDGWSLVLSIVIAFVTGFAVNLWTPGVKAFLTNRASSSRQAKIDRYKARLDLILLYYDNKQTFLIFLLTELLAASTFAIIGFVVLAFSITGELPFAERIWPALMGVAIGTLWRAYKLADDVLYVKNSTASLRHKIEKIEAKRSNPGHVEAGE